MNAQSQPTRRQLLLGAGAAAVAGSGAVGLAGCGSSAPRSPGEPAPRSLGEAAQVPVGGGTIFAAAKVVVTQPVQGEFKGYTTTCPHRGCSVASVESGFIVCPCHHSRFAVATGQPTADSPTPKPLPAVAVSVADGQLVLD